MSPMEFLIAFSFSRWIADRQSGRMFSVPQFPRLGCVLLESERGHTLDADVEVTRILELVRLCGKLFDVPCCPHESAMKESRFLCRSPDTVVARKASCNGASVLLVWNLLWQWKTYDRREPCPDRWQQYL